MLRTRFTASAGPIPAPIRDEMVGVSWHAELGGPPLDALALLAVDHWGFDGAVHCGELVVAAEVADDVIAVFERLFRAAFPIERMRRIEAYGGDDGASMADNNSSAFNARRILRSERLSIHSYGRAIDLNPVQNPVIRGDLVRPDAGRAFLDRARDHPGMIVRPGAVVEAFESIGWSWGGDWTSPKDYHHFELRRDGD